MVDLQNLADYNKFANGNNVVDKTLVANKLG